MSIIFTEALKSHNLPLTILLGVVVIYWLVVIIGALGVDSLDFDVDADTDLDANVGSGGGAGMAVLRFLNFGQIPALIIISVLILFLWTLSILGNYIFNGGGFLLVSLGLFFLNLLISAVITKVTTAPLKRLFVALNAEGDTHEPIIGRVCSIRSLEVTTTNGQAEIERDGATLLINVRISEDQKPLSKGDEALVVSEDPETGYFSVRKSDLTQNLNQIQSIESEQTNE